VLRTGHDQGAKEPSTKETKRNDNHNNNKPFPSKFFSSDVLMFPLCLMMIVVVDHYRIKLKWYHHLKRNPNFVCSCQGISTIIAGCACINGEWLEQRNLREVREEQLHQWHKEHETTLGWAGFVIFVGRCEYLLFRWYSRLSLSVSRRVDLHNPQPRYGW
jgi:hypothetical protein